MHLKIHTSTPPPTHTHTHSLTHTHSQLLHPYTNARSQCASVFFFLLLIFCFPPPLLLPPPRLPPPSSSSYLSYSTFFPFPFPSQGASRIAPSFPFSSSFSPSFSFYSLASSRPPDPLSLPHPLHSPRFPRFF